jgi:hypothetical protein
MHRTLRLALLATPLALAAFTLAGCASRHEVPDTFAFENAEDAESTPLGGETLALRKRELLRAHRDMGHFLATLESLRHRRDRSGGILFSGFLDAYMGEHLGPLLASRWQSDHPELAALDASLRLAEAEVLIQMNAPGRAQQVLDDVSQRFEGRGSMLVELAPGGQTTLQEALRQLRERKWRG